MICVNTFCFFSGDAFIIPLLKGKTIRGGKFFEDTGEGRVFGEYGVAAACGSLPSLPPAAVSPPFLPSGSQATSRTHIVATTASAMSAVTILKMRFLFPMIFLPFNHLCLSKTLFHSIAQ